MTKSPEKPTSNILSAFARGEDMTWEEEIEFRVRFAFSKTKCGKPFSAKNVADDDGDDGGEW